MTLYEEAGLSTRATAEEIRQAYHNFVRLLHPDTVRDPVLQTVAETQLRRINGVFEVLTDPKRRAEYDLTLNPARQANHPALLRSKHADLQARPSLWGILLVVGITVLFWATGKPATRAASALSAAELQNETTGVPIEIAQPTPVPAGTAEELHRLRRELHEVQRRQEITDPSEGASEDELDAGNGAESSTASIAPSDRGLTAPAPFAPLAVPASPSMLATSSSKPATQGSLYGTWLYAQRADFTPKKDWYPPDFIELKVQPSASGMAGRFQARYRVGDRPISPEVRFRFEGKGDAMVWVGPNGAQGEIRVKQISPLTVQVDWSTTRTGEIPSLTSGSSLLVRSPE